MVKKLIDKLWLFNIGDPVKDDEATLTTMERLQRGNEYFTSHVLNSDHANNIERVRYLAHYGQDPHAVLVTCSDARISPERIFQAEMGDFFIIRTAGNVVGDIELASIEYAVAKVGIDTIIVMGHENCGAIHSTVDHYGEEPLGSIGHIIKRIEPSVAKAKLETTQYQEVISKAEDYNVLNAVETIKSSPIVQEYMANGKVCITGAKYGIATGKVTFFTSIEGCCK